MLRDDWLAELSEFLRIPSVSADPTRADAVRRAAGWVAEYVTRLGGTAEILEDGRLVDAEIRASTGDDAPTVLAYGHYDVQPPDPFELWESEPFEPTVRGEWLYARGVADDKGQLWMQLKAAEELVGEGRLPVHLRFVCDGEEESDGDSVGRFVERDARGADAAVAMDGWMKRWGRPELVTATRGIVAAEVELRTGDRDLHSGHYGGTALNAIHALAQALTALFPRDGRLPEPLRQGIVPPGREELESWRAMPPGDEELGRVGAKPLDPRAADEFYVRTWAEPSVDVTAILGGKPGLRNTTVVSRAYAQVTVRITPGQDPAVIGAALERLLRDAAPEGSELTVELSGGPAGVVAREGPVLEAGVRALERVFGVRPLVVRVGGTLPIVPSLAAAGIPTLMVGMATPDCNTHSPNERMLLEAFPTGVAAARELYVELGSALRRAPA
ncbi:MAG: M20/M25/M40 family metallo-hydrolase [Thermoleophilia bacterium]|nr:M20/M25/M40 family metallo-hydrolase [Thermoleophilia bacterium]